MPKLRPESWGYPGDQGEQCTIGGPARLVPFGGQGGWVPSHRVRVWEGCLEFYHIRLFMIVALTLDVFRLVNGTRRRDGHRHLLTTLFYSWNPGRSLCNNHECFHEGSGGGTPHSGVPAGRSMRLGSQSSAASALSFCWWGSIGEIGKTQGVWKERLTKYSSRMSNFLFRFSRPSSCSFVT